MDDVFVSVVINNYNYGRFLPDAIDSALAQTYSALEVIVVDDGSTDDSKEVIARYGDRIIPVLKQNAGQVSAVEAGVKASRGEIVCMLDSDDYWNCDKVKQVVAAFAASPSSIMAYHLLQPIDLKGHISGRATPAAILEGDISDIVTRSGGYWMFPPMSALAFSRHFLEYAIRGIAKYVDRIRADGSAPEESVRLCADAYLADFAPFCGPVAAIGKVLGVYRLHGENNWNNNSRLKRNIECLRTEKRFYYSRLEALNEQLRGAGRGVTVSIENHWPYKRLSYLLEGSGFLKRLSVSWCPLSTPYQPSFIRRLRQTIRWCLWG